MTEIESALRAIMVYKDVLQVAVSSMPHDIRSKDLMLVKYILRDLNVLEQVMVQHLEEKDDAPDLG